MRIAQLADPPRLSARRPPALSDSSGKGWRLEVLDVQRRATTQVRLLLPLTAGDDRS